MDVVELDEKAVSEVNAAFYAAFEARDLDAMADLWEHSDRAAVTHPGWPTMRGWARVAVSFGSIFEQTPFIQFFLTDEQIVVSGDVAWVLVEENVLQATDTHGSRVAESLLGDATATAVNVFVRSERGWRMVVHHAAPVASPEL